MSILTPKEKTFVETIEGLGKFVFKYPTIADDLAIDALRGKILSDNPRPTEMIGDVANMIATLRHVMQEAPDNFDLDDLYDYEALLKVYISFTKQVRQFRGIDKRKRNKGKSAQPSQDDTVLVQAEV